MAADPKDLPDFEYECSEGHYLGGDKPIKYCPVYFRGSPCSGNLERFGKGSRADNRATNNGGTK